MAEETWHPVRGSSESGRRRGRRSHAPALRLLGPRCPVKTAPSSSDGSPTAGRGLPTTSHALSHLSLTSLSKRRSSCKIPGLENGLTACVTPSWSCPCSGVGHVSCTPPVAIMSGLWCSCRETVLAVYPHGRHPAGLWPVHCHLHRYQRSEPASGVCERAPRTGSELRLSCSSHTRRDSP